ncbi:MAG: alginate export family protein [Verrucomicrobiales bacterium]
MHQTALRLTATAAFTSWVHAGTPAPTPPPPEIETPQRKVFAWEVQERARWEIKDNVFDFNDSLDSINDDNWLLNRFRLGFTLKPTDWFTFYAQGQDSREWFSDRPDTPGAFGAEGNDAFDLRQAYAEFSNYAKSPWGLRIGRQTLAYGDQRLIGPLEWTNLARSFDAVRLTYKGDDWSVDAFTSSVVKPERSEFNESDFTNDDITDRDQIFSGAYFSTTKLEFQTTDLYALHLHENASDGDTDFVTLGTRWKSKAERFGPWDYDAEFAFQTGEVGSRDLTAFASHLGGGYSVPGGGLWKSRFGLEYNFASGDGDPLDGDIETFQNLFPTNHIYYGFIDAFAWQNIHNVALTWKASPCKNVTTRLDFHAFWLADTNDSWYRANGTTTVRPLNAAARGADNFAGTELDFVVTWQAHKHVALEAGYSRFFAGNYLSDTGASDDANFGYVQTTITF